jgi:hypothetical protein
VTDPRVEELRAEARFHRQRYDLYRARAYGLRPVSETRLRELERAALAAEERLRHAESGPAAEPPPPA